MKSDFHFHFYSRIIIMAVLAVSLIVLQQSVRSTAQITTHPYEIGGWAWNSQYDENFNPLKPIGVGWISLNCFNDFDTPGVYDDRCGGGGGAYGLKIEETTSLVTGCAWAGNNLSNGVSPLGWICFSDPDPLDAGPSYAVATSSIYLNALESDSASPNGFASILGQEEWRCVGGPRPTTRCPSFEEGKKPEYCDQASGGVCTFVTPDNEAWKLGFPIDMPASGDPKSGNLEGCFNCYEEKEWRCSDVIGVLCGESSNPVGRICDADTEGSCVVYSVDQKCQNCLDYVYYDGRCELPGEVAGDLATYGTHTACRKNADCVVATETCEKISTCRYYHSTGEYLDEYDCTDDTVANTNETCDLVPPCVEHNIGDFNRVLGGYDCSSCEIEDYGNRCGLNSKEANINRCGSCAKLFYTPGVMIDHNYYNQADLPANEFKAYMCGWGWNAWDDGFGNISGLDWFQFGPRVVTSTKPYLSVERGSIYSQKSISNKYLPPFGRFNASYLIESGGSITNFITSSTLSGAYQGERPYSPIINFPTLSNGKYTNALGSIDYDGLINDFSGDGSAINKFGSAITSYSGTAVNITSLNNALNTPLNRRVLYFNGDLILPAGIPAPPVTIKTGNATNSEAAGVIVVDGDLWAYRNILYESSAYANLKEIPSVVWIIKGDLKIGPDTTDLAGTFIVLGDSSVAADCSTPVDSCGQVITCDGTTPEACDDNFLIIRGNVIAKYFNLNRLYVDSVSGIPSEQFINDGRLQVNPPPGFEEFSNIIPRFTEN